MTVSPITPPELPKRFYAQATAVETAGGHQVHLDGRALRTPGKAVIQLSAQETAQETAAEWAAQGERIDPSTMPMTRLVNTIVDGVVPDPAAIRDDLSRYVETDLLVYRAEGPEGLCRRQSEGWDPILAWAQERIGGPFHMATGVMHVAQPPQTLERFRAILSQTSDPFRVAALHQMTTLTGSAILALAVAEERVTGADAFELAHVDEDWNISLWGDDAEAAARRAARRADMLVAERLYRQMSGQMPANHS
ncbi:ATP12 family chaperone protein [Aureimonas frigidaquae]|uniref:ATPase n=1 Tax=Aureimonas frigidaquae TaxID=424757 RepID=A0A0P0Z202_9HYPH|nr:ATP12 family protein [Aureimonas frigidaquae]BAT28072.1 hypothetical protein [Aureimonas frigidaquae]